MTERNNTLNIIIPSKNEENPTLKSKDKLLRNLGEIGAEELNNIAREMRIRRMEREKKQSEEYSTKHSSLVSSFWSEVARKKTKNITSFKRLDCKVTENWETIWIVLLYDYTRDYHDSFSDPEYWTKIFVKVWDYETELEFVYRDAKYSELDDWSKAYTKIDHISINGDTLKVRLGKKEWTPTLYEIKVPKSYKKREKPNISYSEVELFKRHIESEKELLLKILTKDVRYPNIFGYWARQIPNLPINNIPYDQATIVDEYITAEYWIAYIVFKTQIDADNVKWKQYSRQKYRIEVNSSGYETSIVEEFKAWEEELANGIKPNIKATD